MDNELPKGMYFKEYKCPVCDHDFKTVRLKSNASALDKKDEDFCPYYKGLNPLHYEIIVCTECAYAASEIAFSVACFERHSSPASASPCRRGIA